MKTTKRNIIASLIILALILPFKSEAFWPFTKSKTEHEEVHKTANDTASTEVHDATTGNKNPNVTVSGSSNSISIAAQPFHQSTDIKSDGGANSNLQTESDLSIKTKLPWSIALLLLIAAGFLGLRLIQAARQQSVAFNAALSLADNGFAKVLTKVESHISTETDPVKLNLLNSIATELNKQRGAANSQDWTDHK